jgi:hypothetical protein
MTVKSFDLVDAEDSRLSYTILGCWFIYNMCEGSLQIHFVGNKKKLRIYIDTKPNKYIHLRWANSLRPTRPDNTITMERKDEKTNNSPQNTTQKTQDWATRSSLNTWVGLSELAHLKCMYLNWASLIKKYLMIDS